jgi:hypothetical protein
MSSGGGVPKTRHKEIRKEENDEEINLKVL